MTKYTKFELARLIGARALQIECGAPPLIPIDPKMDPITIAKIEIEKGVVPLVVFRE